MKNANEMELKFDGRSSNEGFARVAVSAFLTQLNPTVEEVKKAMEPLFTTRPELERAGMGFSFMEAFMDKLEVQSEPGKGTVVKMEKKIGKGNQLWTAQKA